MSRGLGDVYKRQLNNRKIATYAYQQARINTDTYDRNAFANRYSYAQGIRVYLNVGIRF